MKTYAFIDASNLFYGGEKSLGWKIDYQKLFQYLKEKYGASKVLYFGGVEIHNFQYDYQTQETVPIGALEKHLAEFLKNQGRTLNEASILLIGRHLQRVRFYNKLNEFGYTLFLKPVKMYNQDDGTTKRKANCDVDMAFHLMKEKDYFDRAIVLSGDGDFLPVLKHMQSVGKEVIILSRGPRTAREIRQFAGSGFRDFVRLKKFLKYTAARARASVIIIKDDRVLLFHRIKNGLEYYAVPGGGINEGETPTAAALREIKEETNLDAVLEKDLGVLETESDQAHPEMGMFKTHFFLCRQFTGKPKIGSEELQKPSKDNTYQLEWISLDKLDSIPIRDEIKNLIRKIEN